MRCRVLAVIILGSVTFIPSLRAQILKETFSRFDSLSNLTYKAVVAEKDLFSNKIFKDTLASSYVLSNHQSLFKIAGRNVEEVYDGNKLIKMDLVALTYRIANGVESSRFQTTSIPYIIASLKKDIEKKSPIKLQEDSIINGEKYLHVSITELDTVKKGKRVYRVVQLLVDKINHLPIYYRSDIQGFIDGTDMFVDTYSEVHFYDYQTNQKGLEDLSSFVVPTSFAIEKVSIKPMLVSGTKAPELDLKDAKGDSFLLKKQKGKVVLLNFTATSCPHGAESINMLNNLYSRYGLKNFTIVTINAGANREDIELYNKKGNVKYPIFISSGTHNIDSYNVENYPTFYLVDKKGNIIKAFIGYYDSLTEELNSLIKRHL